MDGLTGTSMLSKSILIRCTMAMERWKKRKEFKVGKREEGGGRYWTLKSLYGHVKYVHSFAKFSKSRKSINKSNRQLSTREYHP